MKKGLIAVFAGGAMMVMTVPSISMANNNYVPPPSGVNSYAPGEHAAPAVRVAPAGGAYGEWTYREGAVSAYGTAIPAKITPDYLLNEVNQFDQREENLMGVVHGRSNANQPLKTLATTIRHDLNANQHAIHTLAHQYNINVQGHNGNGARHNDLNNLHGAAFNDAFINSQIRRDEQELRLLHDARDQPQSRDMRVFIGQTVPVLQAHLLMARNLKNDMLTMATPENPANNHVNNGNQGNGARYANYGQYYNHNKSR